MAHLNEEPGQHDVTVSMYIVKVDAERPREVEPRLFLHMHKVAKRWFQPGGHVERDETIWQTVEHELHEETGYTLDQLQVLQPSPRFPEWNGQSYPVPLVMRSHQYEQLDHVHDDLVFAFITSEEPQLQLDPSESQETGFFTLTDVLQIPDSEIGPDVKVIANALLKSWHSWDSVPTAYFGQPPAAEKDALQLALTDAEVHQAHARIQVHPALFSTADDIA
jgi:8-oxo-dGTP pyrophosphatase MutT (NUDIX family)